MSTAAYMYSMWDGTQKDLAPSSDDLMGQIADQIMDDGSLSTALRNLFQRGINDAAGQPTAGLREMMERIRQERQAQLQKYNLDSIMDEVRDRLNQVLETERKGIENQLNEKLGDNARSNAGQDLDLDNLRNLISSRAERNMEFLDNLPASIPGAIQELSQYDFVDSDAREQFQDLMDTLSRRALENIFQNLKQQLQEMSKSDLDNINNMLGDLNQMMHERSQGRDLEFQRFMERYGENFGPVQPDNLDQLIDQLSQRMAQSQALLDSMSPQMRQEFMDTMESAMSQDTLEELEQLGEFIRQMYPNNQSGRQYNFRGDESLQYEEAMDLMSRLRDLDEIEMQFQEAIRRGNIEDIDSSRIEDVLGEDSRRNIENLQEITRMLEEAGYLSWEDGKPVLTPKAVRKIGQKAMNDVFGNLKMGRTGEHEDKFRGSGGEYTGDTKPYEFGDPFDVHLGKTVRNAVFRQGIGTPVMLTSGDFEVLNTEHTTQASTVLLLDQSRSMGLYGNFQAAKKVAMALSSLINTKYPRDRLYIIGFSDYAVEVKQNTLLGLSWNDWVSGTNMHHAFLLSRKLLAKENVGTKQIIMVTDGEPTTHLEGTHAIFGYPPTQRTVQETLKEVRRCTQNGIVINTFMLESSPYLIDFVDKMMRINKGRAFYSTPQKLGEYILVDYVASKKSKISH
jgi:uncharacterized protein with von Willebrand factor type A (vWA) domain